MNINMTEMSYNLRLERGKKNCDYSLEKWIAQKQLQTFPTADVHIGVEWMECNHAEYMLEMQRHGFTSYESSLDEKNRGNVCWMKDHIKYETICKWKEPHFLHIRIMDEKTYIDLMIVRILVGGSNAGDFKNRALQWEKVMQYLDRFEDLSHAVLTGDFNHGVISYNGLYKKDCARYFFNYHMMERDLDKRELKIQSIDGYSSRVYHCRSERTCDLKIDHLIAGKAICVKDAEYIDTFDAFQNYKTRCVGIPDHKMIKATLCA